jgi:hypothetical protein
MEQEYGYILYSFSSRLSMSNVIVWSSDMFIIQRLKGKENLKLEFVYVS